MEIRKVHCLFEQSGTFKNEFLKLGIDAEDYDIQNEFGETDNVIDLFAEIQNGYEGKPSIFDKFGKSDMVFAFFPCTRFQEDNALLFSGVHAGIKGYSDLQKLEYSMKLHQELHEMYMTLSKLFCLALRGGVETGG